MNPKFKKYQIPIRRAPDGKILGVFKGIAQTSGWSVCMTRVVGFIALALIAGAFGSKGSGSGLLAIGFFYLLLAIFMRPPAPGREDREDTGNDLADDYPPGRARSPRPGLRYRTAAVPHYQAPRPRVDLAALDRQLDGLNRRIQRMETIVTDRQYDWDRRMNS